MSDSSGVSAPVVLAEGLRKSYRHRLVLDVERFEVHGGQTHALLGPSGSGKSTLLRIVGLLERPDAGTISIDGRKVDARERRRMDMAAVFQRPYLFNGTVADNVAYGLRLRHVPRHEQRSRIDAVLAQVGLAGTGDLSALTLSGGEAQRVSLARALVLEPRILFLDEPLSNLDPLIKQQLEADFSRILHETGMTTVYVTHDQNEAMVVADRVSIMFEGRVVHTGSLDEVMGLPADEWVAGFVGMEPPLRGTVVGVQDGIVTINCGGMAVHAVGSPSVGTSVIVGVRPEDVTLFASADLPATSARNRLECLVDEVEPRGVTARVRVTCGSLRIAAAVSRASAIELGLVPGLPVVAVFKATAVRMRMA